jgi:hypothetical protein
MKKCKACNQSVPAGAKECPFFDPPTNGQPCQSNSDCHVGSQACLIDAPITDCKSGPVGHCVPYANSNMCQLNHSCSVYLVLFGTVCSTSPGTSRVFTSGCVACLPPVDSGVDAF